MSSRGGLHALQGADRMMAASQSRGLGWGLASPAVPVGQPTSEEDAVVTSSGSIPGEGDAFIGGAGFPIRAIEEGAAVLRPATVHWTGENRCRALTSAVRTGLRNVLRSRALRWGVTLA